MAFQKERQRNDSIQAANPGRDIEVFLYTDPLCCWSWASKTQINELRAYLGKRAAWHTRMAGLLPDWLNFHDQVNMVSKPVQMGPVWMHAGQIAGEAIRHEIWFRDPPHSSYPACIAVKSAWLQSPELGELYLDHIRDACMLRGVNISKKTELFALAEEFSAMHKTLDLARFMLDFENGNAKEAFKRDLEFVRYNNINRFPALIIKHQEKAIMISGYRSYSDLVNAVENIVPS